MSTTLRIIWRALLTFLALWMLWRVLVIVQIPYFRDIFISTIFIIAIIAVNLFILIAFLFYLIYSFARTAVSWFPPGQNRIGLHDYHGNPAVVVAAQPIVEMVQQARSTRRKHDGIINGLVLHGAPGSGKKMLAQAIANEADVPWGYVNARSLTDGWFGTDNLKVRMLYRKAYQLARTHGACMLYIDEIEVLGDTQVSHLSTDRQRSISTTSNPFHELLIQMDMPPVPGSWWRQILGIPPRHNNVNIPLVLTIGATGNAAQLDAALLRPGRLDSCIAIPPPDAAGRHALFTHELASVPHESLPIERLVQETSGATPAAIKQIISAAVSTARREGRQAITYRDVVAAHLVYTWREQQPVPTLPYQQRRLLAYHQAGHAYMQAQLMGESRLTTLSVMVPQDTAPHSSTALLPTSTRDELLADIQVALAGRVAEEELLGIKTTASADDLAHATSIATALIGRYGMESHLSTYATDTGHGDLHERVEHLLQWQYRQVREQIAQNCDTVMAIAEALLLCHTLTSSDIREIVAGVSGR